MLNLSLALLFVCRINHGDRGEFSDKARTAIGMTMQAYPKQWQVRIIYSGREC